MKKRNIRILGFLTISTMFLSGCSIEFNVKDRNENIWESESEVVNQEIAINGAEKINITMKAADLKINVIDGDKVTVKSQGEFIGSENLELKTENNIITIEDKMPHLDLNNLIKANESNRKLEIGIPKSFAKEVKLQIGAGNCRIADLVLDNFTVEGGAGNIEIDNITFKNFTLDQGVGNVDIDLKNKSGNMSISGGVGNFEIKIQEVGGNLTYEGGVGKGDIDIPDNSPVQIITDSGLGNVNIEAKTSGDTYKFNLEIGVGGLTIH